MCQYSAFDGHHTDWHFGHLAGIISRGPGLTVIEATAVLPEGRITPEDSGLWKDSQIAPLKRITEFAHSQGQKMGIQLAHAGRKGATVAPWVDRKGAATKAVGGWPENVRSVSDIPYSAHTYVPRALSLDDIESFKVAWVAAVKRSLAAGFDVIEIHAAHGYLLHSFLSAATNDRTDQYGGSLENRMRLVLEIVELTRANIPSSMPLFIRIPATDWVEYDSAMNGWTIEEAEKLSKALGATGSIDLIDVSSGGLLEAQKIKAGPSYQAPFSGVCAKAVEGKGVAVGMVGMLTSGKQVEELLQKGLADVAFVGRAFLKNPGLVWQWAEELQVEARVASQIGWGFSQRGHGGVKPGKELAARG